jgi:hypothetical protein
MQFPDQWDHVHDTPHLDVVHNKKRRRRKDDTTCQTPHDVRANDDAAREYVIPKTDASCDNGNTSIVLQTPPHTQHPHMELDSGGLTSVSDVAYQEEDCVPIHLSLHSLISRMPFKEMMNQMFVDDMSSVKVVPIVTKAFEESFLREPMLAHEKPCVCGENCEFNFIDPMYPFVGVEFKLHKDTVAGEDAAMCVLCSRKLTQELFYKMVYTGEKFLGFIQRYGNLCQQPGEYAREAVLVCPSGGPVSNMPLPIVSHQRHKYSVIMQHGVKYLKQHNVAFEDFQNASSSVP